MHAAIHLSRHQRIGPLSPLVFGGFLEHMGRSIYEGVFDPGSTHADADGLRTDVIAALAELELSIVRYPGGNFASGYHWQDGVGPRDTRPTVRELAWQSIETNEFGTDEFLALASRLDWQPMLAVNLGTGTPEEARNWVEYCNAPAGTRYADLRAANGREVPYGVTHWCLGNEMDGPWQLGHVPAGQYAIRAQQAAKMMKDVDPRIETVACGSSAPSMATFLEWDRTVLEHLEDLADYVSLHRYVGNKHANTTNYLAVANSVDAQIEAVDATCRYVAARHGLARRPLLCFDEWNVWYKARSREHMDGKGRRAPHLIEELYNLEDALVVASFLMCFIRHADVVKIANLAQLVNVIAPLLTRGDDLLKQSIFHAFRMISSRKGGISLAIAHDGPEYETTTYGTATVLDAAATLDGERLNVFVVNRSTRETADVAVATDLALIEQINAECLMGDSADAHNTFEQPDRVVAAAFSDTRLQGSTLHLSLPPLSLCAVSIRCE